MNSKNWVQIGYVCFMVILSFIAASGCSGDRASEVIVTKDISGRGWVNVRPLDFEGSKFLGQYGEWDEWIYDNIVTQPTAFMHGERPENWMVLTARVTPEGLLVPTEEKTRLHHEGLKNGDYDYWKTCPFQVQAAGVMEPELAKARRLAIGIVRGKYYPRVPDWLAEQPPYHAMLMPNGDVVTSGALGSSLNDSEQDEECCGSSNHSYYRYSADGTLIATSPRFWWYLYYEGKNSELPDGEFHTRKDGYVYFMNPDTDEILSVWDWNGEELKTASLPDYRDAHNFLCLRPSSLTELSEGQRFE